MGAFVAADVTITKVKRQRVGLMKESLYLLAFGDASKTVPTNGIPLPALGLFGLKRVDFHQIAPVTVNGYGYRYDEVNHSLRLFQVAGFTPAGSNTAESTHVHVENAAGAYSQNANTAAGASHNHVFTGTPVVAGALSEVPTTHAPAATVLRLMLRGK